MNRTVFRYGIFATLTMLVLFAIQLFLLANNSNLEANAVFGYLTMILCMVFVFLGIRYYRDHVSNGTLTFGRGLKIGILIVLIPAVFFGLFDILYTEVIDPGWKNEYYADAEAKIRANTPPDKVERKLKALDRNKEMFENPVFQFFLMAGTVFVIGFIVTIISALTLRRNVAIKK
jgi:hypothetical protein